MPDETRAIDIPSNSSRGEAEAQFAWDVVIRNTIIMRESLRRFFPNADLSAMVAEARELARKVKTGDRTHFEATLCMQGAVLQAEASELSRRANDLLDNPDAQSRALDMYDVAIRMRMAYLATVNCLGRMDIETKRAGGRARARRVGG